MSPSACGGSCIVPSMLRCSASSRVRARSEPMPMRVLSGVRSSWRITARRRLRAPRASSARCGCCRGGAPVRRVVSGGTRSAMKMAAETTGRAFQNGVVAKTRAKPAMPRMAPPMRLAALEAQPEAEADPEIARDPRRRRRSAVMQEGGDERHVAHHRGQAPARRHARADHHAEEDEPGDERAHHRDCQQRLHAGAATCRRRRGHRYRPARRPLARMRRIASCGSSSARSARSRAIEPSPRQHTGWWRAPAPADSWRARACRNTATAAARRAPPPRAAQARHRSQGRRRRCVPCVPAAGQADSLPLAVASLRRLLSALSPRFPGVSRRLGARYGRAPETVDGFAAI